ncbi:BnaCnng36070D [Brassica napus]|uniref:BnaCnng36070D protein n=1 Tax=Brassica napus TaxID=3708 RepID=A0A078J6Z5_BRANA|nr:BnaCnng36070D [Brassica napus]
MVRTGTQRSIGARLNSRISSTVAIQLRSSSAERSKGVSIFCCGCGKQVCFFIVFFVVVVFTFNIIVGWWWWLFRYHDASSLQGRSPDVLLSFSAHTHNTPAGRIRPKQHPTPSPLNHHQTQLAQVPSLKQMVPSIRPSHVSSLFSLDLDPKTALNFSHGISHNPRFKHSVYSYASILVNNGYAEVVFKIGP